MGSRLSCLGTELQKEEIMTGRFGIVSNGINRESEDGRTRD